ncbi:hypothetical protein KCP73_16910 [Salmonella enterica subsp. enterica]|nr:hypothetical protein KCP73_16910 [Salmonella enterica subsp. enterica]
MLIKMSHHRRRRGGFPAASSASDQKSVRSRWQARCCGYYRRRADARSGQRSGNSRSASDVPVCERTGAQAPRACFLNGEIKLAVRFAR